MPHHDRDDAELAQGSRTGDLAAFEEIVRRHQQLLLNVAFRMTGSYDDACEIVQDSFLAAWQKMGDFRGESRLSTWLTAIVVNRSRNRRVQTQQRSRHETCSLDAAIPGTDEDTRPDPPSGEPSALERLQEEELRRFLQRCIEALPAEFREVVVLRDMQDFTYDQIAATLALREGTVKSRLFRARDSLKECLKKAVGRV